jgi:hypothetical protein
MKNLARYQSSLINITVKDSKFSVKFGSFGPNFAENDE